MWSGSGVVGTWYIFLDVYVLVAEVEVYHVPDLRRKLEERKALICLTAHKVSGTTIRENTALLTQALYSVRAPRTGRLCQSDLS